MKASIKNVFNLVVASTVLSLATTEASAQNGGFGKVLGDINKGLSTVNGVLGTPQNQPHKTNTGVINLPDAEFQQPHVYNSLPTDTLYSSLRPWRNNPEFRIISEQFQGNKKTDYRNAIDDAQIEFNNLKARAGWVFAGSMFGATEVFNSPDPVKSMRDKIEKLNKQIRWSSVTLANANQLFQDWNNIVARLDKRLTAADDRFTRDMGNKDNEFMRRPFWQAYMTPTRDTATQEKLENNSYTNAQQQGNVDQAAKNGKQDVNQNAGRPKQKTP